MKPRRAAVLGIGNVLMGDDGFGPYLAQFLQAAYEMPEGLTARELGTPGFHLVPHLAGLDAVIILDPPASLDVWWERTADPGGRGGNDFVAPA